MLWSAATSTSGLRRLVHIVAVLARHGGASLLSALIVNERLNLKRILGPLARRVQTPGRHLRLALEELGTTFVKLGQIVSTRADLLPPEYQQELERLQDAEPPESWEAVRAVIEAELGRPVEELFASVDPKPLATASIGQAHAAVTFDGLDVVVKVRRPGVVEEIASDLDLLSRVAEGITRWTRFGRRHDVVGLAQEFADTLRAEVDYVREARSAERFAASFATLPEVHIPKVVWPLTTHQVLTLERIHGIKITDVASLDARGVDRAELARRSAAIEMKMVFEDGFFHADPHPGNFFVEDDGRIGLIDFGMTGSIDERTRIGLVRLLGALVAKDGDGMVDALESLGVAGAAAARAILRADLLTLAGAYLEQPLGDLSVASLLRDVLAVVRRHHLRLPSNMALLMKTIGMCEGVGAQLDPSFRLTSTLVPFVMRMVAVPTPADAPAPASANHV